MRKALGRLVLAAWLCSATFVQATSTPATAGDDDATDVNAVTAVATKADHSRYKSLQREFQSGPEVTKACLECHVDAAKQVHLTQHWRWEFTSPQGKQKLGKKNVVNNFCTSVASNYQACASCHIGYGMKDASFDFTAEDKVDCLVCHDSTGRYRKPSGFAGHVVTKDTEYPPGSGKIIRGIDLTQIAQKVGKTTRSTCGICHFYGGGGDGVKHGDMDSTLEAPEKSVDVHMAADGLNFACVTCHQTEGHQVPGSRYAPTARDEKGPLMRGLVEKRNPATCQSCHGQTPHKQTAKLNDHTDRVACQTCHIPTFARGDVPTKMSWDWSTAGRRDANGKPLVVKNDEGYDIYLGTKGDFVLQQNVVPEYLWFNGNVTYTLLDDKIDPSAGPLYINRFEGSASDGKSLIWPVKVFRGKQPYDTEYKTLTVNHLAGMDDTAYWKNLDWPKAIRAGMDAVGRPFSGKYGFAETVSMWPITHMVAPKDEALGCADCHRSGGRLDKVDGVYVPGRSRDHLPLLEAAGWGLAGLTLLGVLGHGLARIVTRNRKH